ncbi:MAG: hypothetical protein HYT72_04475 [Candidatus Aenigmarchaeota archaeon]|nr:hypothetical protein [Candidatus Aenigmarchaeota archaeon]
MAISISKRELDNKTRLEFNPTLESILMVERAIKKYSGEYKVYQLWKKLPRKITYQAYKIIIAYLINSNKITMDKRKVLVWIWNPGMIQRLEKQGLIIND